MSFDIYGNTLRSGHCEVHPHVHEEYPCSVCIMETAQREQQQRPPYCDGNPNFCESAHHLAQASEHIKDQERTMATQQARIEALEARLKAYELYYGVMTDAAIQYALNSGRGNNPTEKEWLAASVHAEIVKLEARIQTLERVWLVAERLCTAIDSAEQDAGHESIDDILAELGPALDAVEPRPQEPTP